LAGVQAFAAHPKRPDALRVEQLAEPWEEGALDRALELRPREAGVAEFETSCAMAPPALFETDPAFERSIFLPEGALQLRSNLTTDNLQVCVTCWLRC
jgi:hypothetical protein